MKCSLGISNFLGEISSLSHSIVFLSFFALITEEYFLFSTCYSLELWFQMGISFLFLFAFHFSSFHSYVRPPQTAILLFCISFPWGWCWSLSPVQCHEPQTIVHQALYQISSLKSISHFHCIIIRDLICCHPTDSQNSLLIVRLLICFSVVVFVLSCMGS